MPLREVAPGDVHVEVLVDASVVVGETERRSAACAPLDVGRPDISLR